MKNLLEKVDIKPKWCIITIKSSQYEIKFHIVEQKVK